jgi:hypothetical protein
LEATERPKAGIPPIAHDDVVKNLNAQNRADVHQAMGQLDIVAARRRIAAWVIVRVMCLAGLCFLPQGIVNEFRGSSASPAT